MATPATKVVIPTTSGKKVEGSPLTVEEKNIFTAAWSRMTYVLGYDGPWNIFDISDYNQTLEYLAVMKELYGPTKPFEGMDPNQGWGVRMPLTQDVQGTTAAAFIVWDVTWGTTGDRGWLCDNVPDADAFASEGWLLMKYTTDDTQWGFGMLGVLNWSVSPKIKNILLNRERTQLSTLPCEFGFRSGQVPLSKWPNIEVWKPGVMIKAGVTVRTGQLGLDAPYPLGLVALDAQRARTPTASLTGSTEVA